MSTTKMQAPSGFANSTVQGGNGSYTVDDAGFFVASFGKKVATGALAVALFGAALLALLATFRGLVSPLVAAAFSTEYGQFIGLAFPPVAGNCLATIAACWAACVLYRWQATAIQISNSAS